MADRRFIPVWLAVVLAAGIAMTAAVAWLPAPIVPTTPGEPSPSPLSPPARALYGWLLLSSALILFFLISTAIIVRWSRRHRARLERNRRQNTASDDVWQMHRLPEE